MKSTLEREWNSTWSRYEVRDGPLSKREGLKLRSLERNLCAFSRVSAAAQYFRLIFRFAFSMGHCAELFRTDGQFCFLRWGFSWGTLENSLRGFCVQYGIYLSACMRWMCFRVHFEFVCGVFLTATVHWAFVSELPCVFNALSDCLSRQALRRLRPRWGSSARLETRTKESNKCASHMPSESIRRTEREARFLRVRCEPRVILTIDAAPAEAWQSAGFLSLSTHVGTRKVVTYAWTGRSRGKPWWRSVAMLTCKSLVRFGYRGERLIEPPSSWFTPKFPSG